MGENALKYFNGKVWEEKLMAKPVFTDGNYKFIMLYPRGKVDVRNSLNYKMVRKGYAKIDDVNFVSIP